MVHFDLSFEYVLFACFCISVPLYLTVLIILARVPRSDTVLHSSFFRMVLSTGIADVLTAIQTYAYFKFRFWNVAFDFYATIHPVFKYDLIIGFATTFAQSFGNLLIGVNRYTAMSMPMRHAVIWSPYRVRLYIAAQWIIAFIIVIPGAFLELCDITFNEVPDNGISIVNGINYTGVVNTPVFTTRSTALSKKVGIIYQSLTIILWGIGAVITLAIYIRLFFELNVRRRSQASSTRDSTTILLQEYRLLAYGVISALIQATTAALQLLMVLQGFNKWYRPQAAAVDAANYSHPYFLLGLSTALRKRCFPCNLKIKAWNTAIAPSGFQPSSTVDKPIIYNRYQLDIEHE